MIWKGRISLLHKISTILLAFSYGSNDSQKVMTNLADFGVMNEIYATYFPSGVYPSRSAFQVGALPKGQ